MATFSNRFSIGDTVHTSMIGTSGVLTGTIATETDLGVTIEFKETSGGGTGVRFVPWTSVRDIYKKGLTPTKQPLIHHGWGASPHRSAKFTLRPVSLRSEVSADPRLYRHGHVEH